MGEALSGSELDVNISQMVLNIYEKLSEIEISLAIVPLRGVKFEGGILRLGRFIIIKPHECDKESLISIDNRLQDFYDVHPDEGIIAIFQYRGTRGYAAAAAVAATRQLVKMLSYYLALESTPTIPLPDSTLSFGIKDNETFIYCIGEDLVETNEAELQNYIPSLKVDRDLDDYFCTDLAFHIEGKSVKLEIENSFLKAYFWIAEAQRQRDNSSAFICFCIALEILLSPARNEHSPISRSIAERLAFLFGTNIESRKRIFSTAKFLYDLRSDIIHSGADEKIDTENLSVLQGMTLHSLAKLGSFMRSKTETKRMSEWHTEIEKFRFFSPEDTLIDCNDSSLKFEVYDRWLIK